MWKPDRWWRDRLYRQDAASAKFKSATTDDEIIEAVAEYLIAQGSPRRPYRLHLLILNMSEERPVSHDWRYKNVCGISTIDENRARAWIRDCMRQGYGVFISNTKNGLGRGKGSVAYIRQQRELSFGRTRSAGSASEKNT
jgi:hypothetical protein